MPQLQVKVKNTGAERQVPFYVVDSNTPFLSGELANCGIILGTNGLDNLSLQISLLDGSTITQESAAGVVNVTAMTNPDEKPNETDQSSTERKSEAPVS